MPFSNPNRFDQLRLLAALAVFAAHVEALYHGRAIAPFAGHRPGTLAVYAFFFISGFLVQQSWQRDAHWGRFWLRRAVRIFPGLVVAVVFSVLLGWVVSTSPGYWADGGIWRYLVNNAFGLATVHALPGVFESNPYAQVVNGSLWTIRYELMMYLALSAMAWLMQCWGRVSAPRRLWPAMALLLAALWCAARSGGWDAALGRMYEAGGTSLKYFFLWEDFCAFGVMFFLGSSMSAYAAKPQKWMLAAAALAGSGMICSGGGVLGQLALWVCMTCGVFYAAHCGNVGQRWHTDISYGIYIYAFPLQQAAVQWCLSQHWPFWVCVLLCLLPTFAMAWFSWHCIERPAIRMGRRILARRRPGAHAGPAPMRWG